ncbi:unnamed protein product [Schistosoma intercalatum]|nr:unnamed protein product [Schistosoma intercalatum]
MVGDGDGFILVHPVIYSCLSQHCFVSVVHTYHVRPDFGNLQFFVTSLEWEHLGLFCFTSELRFCGVHIPLSLYRFGRHPFHMISSPDGRFVVLI